MVIANGIFCDMGGNKSQKYQYSGRVDSRFTENTSREIYLRALYYNSFSPFAGKHLKCKETKVKPMETRSNMMKLV